VSLRGFQRLPMTSLLGWLLSQRDPEAELDMATGTRRLTYSRRFQVTTIVVLVVASGAFGFITGLMRDDLNALAGALAIFGLMWLAAMVGAWDAFLTKVSFSSEGIFLDRGARAQSFIPWSAVTRVRYSRLGSWFAFRAPGFRTVRVSIYRNGLKSLAEVASLQLAHAKAGNIPALLFEKARNPR